MIDGEDDYVDNAADMSEGASTVRWKQWDTGKSNSQKTVTAQSEVMSNLK